MIGGAGGDILTGGNRRDTFIFESLSDSLLANFDVIKDLNIHVDKIDAPKAVNARNVEQFGEINLLTESRIQLLLDNTSLVANQAATFTLRTNNGSTFDENLRTFLVINDATNGFNAATDAIIEITGYSGNLGALAIV